MKIHEYQGKEIFRNAGVPIPKGFPAFSVDEAVNAFEKLGTEKVMVKAQIHAGGRGKGGGIKLAKGTDEVQKWADDMLGMNLVTHQTGPEGKKVRRLLIEEAYDITQELYAGIVLDRRRSRFVFMVSTEGGVEIERVAEEMPDKIIKEWINPNEDLKSYQARKLAFALGLDGAQVKYAANSFLSLWKVFTNYDCSLI